jgi:cyclopropane fatty-acyl-phospholipid synthase-like methyltransferase
MAQDIKSMKLYHQVERVFNELRAMGIADSDPIDVEALCKFDQYHYLGTDAVDEGIRQLAIGQDMQVLEVGSGIGGPSRYLAHAAGCEMTAMELQDDLNQTAKVLTERCGLGGKVRHVCGDILNGSPAADYDALVSWLTFLHIPDRPRLYNECFKALKPGAGIYVEDYFERGSLTTPERAALSREVYCDHVPSMDDYRRELEQAGFESIQLLDVSNQWSDFVAGRLAAFEAGRERNIKLHGSDLVTGLHEFYSTIVDLFGGGNLGGICVIARKPL